MFVESIGENSVDAKNEVVEKKKATKFWKLMEKKGRRKT